MANNLKEQARNANLLILWTDADREGEHIGYEVQQACLKGNPRLVVKRARFAALIPAYACRRPLLTEYNRLRQIHQACRNADALDMHQVDAVCARTELDLRIGAALTRFQTLRFRHYLAGEDENEKILISFGGCQFPTLGFIVEAFKRADAFVPEDFWSLQATLTRNGATARFMWNRGRLYDRECCAALNDIVREAPHATVTEAKSKPKSKWLGTPVETHPLIA